MKLRLIPITALAIASVALLSGCSAGYQRGVYAGQASAGIKAETEKFLAHDAEGWSRLKARELQDIESGYESAYADATQLSTPAEAASQTRTVTFKYFADKADWQQSASYESTKANSYAQALQIYALTPVDVSVMADAEQHLAVEVGQHIVAGAIDIAAQAATKASTGDVSGPSPEPTPAPPPATSQSAKRNRN